MLRCLPSRSAILLALAASTLMLTPAGCGGKSVSLPGDSAAPGASAPPAGQNQTLFAVTMRPQTPLEPEWQSGAGKELSLARPSGMLAVDSALKRASYNEADLTKDASACETPPLPRNRVTNDVPPYAVFSPSWTPINPPGLPYVAYCTYRFALADYAQSGREQTIGLRWRSGFEPASYTYVWIGLANWQSDRWDWFAGPADGVLSVGS